MQATFQGESCQDYAKFLAESAESTWPAKRSAVWAMCVPSQSELV